MNELVQILGAISDPVSLILGAVLTAIPSYFLYKKGVKVTELESKSKYNEIMLNSLVETIKQRNKVTINEINRYERHLYQLEKMIENGLNPSAVKDFKELYLSLQKSVENLKSDLISFDHKTGEIVRLKFTNNLNFDNFTSQIK